MNFQLSQALNSIKLSIIESAYKSDKKRLSIYKDVISCKVGCNGCCSRLLYITVAEAIIMYEYLLNNQWKITKVKSLDQIKVIRNSNPVSWFKMNIKCPVLNEKGECSAYPVRPPTCSTHFVSSNPEYCNPWSSETGLYKPVDMDEIMLEFDKLINSKIDSYGVLKIKLPIPMALIFAENIYSQSNKDIEQVVSILFNEFNQ